ncbi:hypothetical protein FJY71_04550 [candidate division WOR-3 bacterium]|nr:hypothetical protein [candidate division WOR-3 bacterium]
MNGKLWSILQSVGVVAIVGAIVWLTTLSNNVKVSREESRHACEVAEATYERLDNRLRPVEQALAVLAAGQGDLLRRLHIPQPAPAAVEAVKRQLALGQDSLPPN